MVDYNIDVKNPFISALEGFQTAQKMQAMRAQSEQIQAAQQRKAEMQAALGQFAARDRTPEEYQRLMQLFPEIADQVKISLQSLNDQQKENKINQLLPVYAALRSGNVEQSKKLLDENIAAARNSGMENEAKMMEQIKSNLDLGPEGVKGAEISASIFLNAADPERFKTVNEAMKLQGEERRMEQMQPGELKKQKADLIKSGVESGLKEKEALKVEAETRKLGLDMQKTIMEMASLEKSGGVTPEKKFDLEDKLRNQYVTRTKNFTDSKTYLDKIRASKDDLSGAGDTALIFSFMKMLDPGSVVRESEFATARDTAGLLSSLQNAYQKAKNGEFLKPEQRRDFARLAEKYMQAAEGQEKKVRDDLGIVAKNYALNPENIFGEKGKEPQGQTADQTAQPQQTEGPPQISDKAQFDALPAGAVYINAKTGQKYRKP